MTEPDKELSELWWGIGIDPITQIVSMLTIDETEAECRQHIAEHLKKPDTSPDMIYTEAFNFVHPDGAQRCYDWLRACGIISTDAKQVLNTIRDELMRFNPGE